MKRIKLLFLPLLVSSFGFGQIVAWEPAGNAGNEMTINATTLDANLNISTLSRGSGINPSSLANAFSSNSFSFGGNQASAIADNDYIEFNISAATGFKVSLSTLDVNFRRSSTGPRDFIWRYSIDGVNFTDIGSAINYTLTASNGTAQAQIDLTGITDLQDVNTGTNIIFRLYCWGGNSSSGTGTFAIGRRTGDDLAIGGSVDPICTTTVTWDGSVWDNVTGPTSSDSAILAGNYNTTTNGSFNSCSLTIDAAAILNIGENTFVSVENEVTNSGEIVIADKGSLVQVEDAATFINSSAVGTPVTVVKRTAPVTEWYEYTYWSSPIPEATLENLLPNTSAARMFNFDASNFNDNEAEMFNSGNYTTNSQDDIDDEGDDWQFASGTMSQGIGYAATLGQDDLLGPPPGPGGIQLLKNFEGSTLNTGIINVSIDRNDAFTTDNNWNLIGNPYPSAIDASAFLTENTYNATTNPNGTLEGAIYFWSHSTVPSATTSGNEQINFNVNDYAILNLSANTGGEQYTPNDFIPSGQGFFVLIDNNANTANNVVFNNTMRVTGNNDQFFRTTNNLDNKLWLNLTSDNGVYSQLAVAYLDGATNGDDGASYDARRFYSGGSAMLVSFAENSIIPLAIQGKQTNALDLEEIIPLGFTTGIVSPTIYTISIDHFQGDFMSNNTVYLKDNLTASIHDLSDSDYSFTSDMGVFNTRFEVVFNNASLSTDDFQLNDNNFSIIELNNDNVLFKTGSELTIKSVQIFDVLARNIYNFKGNNSNETYTLSNLNQTTYVAKIELSNGQTLSKKAIKK